MFFRTFHLGPKMFDDSQQIMQPGGIRSLFKLYMVIWTNSPDRSWKVSSEKQTVPKGSKNVTGEKTDQQEKLVAFAQVVQNVALLELKHV